MPYGGPLPYGQGGYKGRAVAPPAPTGQYTRYYFAFLPNWQTPVQLGYSFQTAITRARKLGEQRRALYDRARRTMKLRVLESKDTPVVQNFIEVNHANNIFVPIYTELQENMTFAG